MSRQLVRGRAARPVFRMMIRIFDANPMAVRGARGGALPRPD